MRLFILFVILILGTHASFSQILTPVVDSIPLRDGKKVPVDIYIPPNCTSCPVILIQTPYNRLLFRLSLPMGIGNNLANSNYAFAITDWRCFYGAASACTSNVDRGKDGYDIVEWIASQPWSNGLVGTWGPSALGKIQYQTAKENPPHLVCAVPLVAGPQTNYQEYYPGGVLRTEYVSTLDLLGFGTSPLILANQVYNLLWQITQNATFYPASIQIPMLMIGGWYDHNTELMTAFFEAIRTQSPVNVRVQHRLLMGPWAHGGNGTAYVGSAQQGELSYPNAAGWNDSLALAFFDHHLRSVNNNWNSTSVVTYYQMAENNWYGDTQWPTGNINSLALYPHANGQLEFNPPTNNIAVSFSSDPKDPSPTIGGPTLAPGLMQGPYNQDPAVEGRSDLIKFTTSPLTQEIKVKGAIKFFSTLMINRTDADLAIRLTDVYPDGRSMLIKDGITRARFRNGFSASDTSSVVPGQDFDVRIDLGETAYTFLPGHCIRIDVSAANYSRFDVNLNNGGAMYIAGDSLNVTHTLRMGPLVNTLLDLPVESGTMIQENLFNRNDLKFYPNPVFPNSTLFFASGFAATNLEVVDISGKKQSGWKFDAEKKSIQCGDKTGVYILRITNKLGISATGKLVIMPQE